MRRDCLNLDFASERQRASLIGQSGGKIRHTCKGLAIGAIDGLVILDVCERHVHRYELGQSETGRPCDVADVGERLLELLLDGADAIDAGLRVERRLARDETEPVDDNRRREGKVAPRNTFAARDVGVAQSDLRAQTLECDRGSVICTTSPMRLPFAQRPARASVVVPQQEPELRMLRSDVPTS
jgi:hypothetical protein